MEEFNLLETMDARIWADEFMRLSPNVDRDLMLAWFASAIMTGSDHRRWKMEPEIQSLKEKLGIGVEALEEIAGEDYRGNRPQSAVTAYKALRKITGKGE